MKNNRFHTVKILINFDKSNNQLPTVMNDYFSGINLSGHKEVTHLVQETIRQRGYIDSLLSELYNGRFEKIEYSLKNILRLGCYELIFRDHVPGYAVVDSLVSLTKEVVNAKASGVTNAVLHKVAEAGKPQIDELTENNSLTIISEITSHPVWMLERWIQQFGFERTLKLCRWNNALPNIMIRKNQKKIDKNSFEKFLNENGISWKLREEDSNFYEVNYLNRLLKTSAFKDGWFSVQDISGGLVCQLVNNIECETILDVCAAPGGKMTYLSEIIENSSLYAYDINEERIKLVEENIGRLGHQHIHVSQADAAKDEFPLADVILIDAPCTGTGVMSKRADLRWRRNESDFSEMQELQLAILSNMKNYLNQNGCLVYSTCSLEQEENKDVISSFLNSNSEFDVENIEPSLFPKQVISEDGFLITFPPEQSMDGIFASVLKRKS
tara:strand:+ start:1922 stop:3244 length:1323 start_codon:yes stop_codon:yes gene_type:complete